MMHSYAVDVTGKLLLSDNVGRWCQLPYPGHPKGCPNYDSKEGCPPGAPGVFDVFDRTLSLTFVVVEFDLGAQARRMKDAHPGWSDRQARCVLYWQGSVRGELTSRVLDVLAGHHLTRDKMVYTLVPEALGVNVIRTARAVGIDIEVKPKDKVVKIALVGYDASKRRQWF